MSEPKLDTIHDLGIWAALHQGKCEERHKNQEKENVDMSISLIKISERVRKIEHKQFWMAGVVAAVSFFGAVVGGAIAASFGG